MPHKPLPLERLLQSQGFGSRKDCRFLVGAGRVAVDGVPCRDAAAPFVPEGRVLTVDGQDWPWRERLYLALDKPAGYECSRQPQHHHPVLALLPAHFAARGVQPVGRLDADTTGLLLLSDDGAWAHGLNSPRRHVAKTYRVDVRHPVDDELVARLLTGVQLHDEPAPLAALACARIDEQVLELVIDQGKYHQVKRMVAAAGNRVDALRRIAVGGLRLGEGELAGLEAGRWRELGPAALALLGEGRA
ncbi:pseudouridine synthase [Chitinimonas koreensis]|uniref:pseudouridine synthase n=1 Tax=Chitinimonas koreensis TaxID=356302 RepID=UPI0003F6115B|nr:pseudouridine synthase [Chitinimonas koreensis]QNM96964.1 pseudouridine synthase [Chitinimonas koreensis]